MRIEKLRLKNFRCFEELELNFDKKLTVLVAENGQGKSTLLDAVRVSLWPYVSAFDAVSGNMSNSGIEIDDVRLSRTSSNNMEYQLPARIETTLSHGVQSIHSARQRDKTSKSSKTTVKEAKSLSEWGVNLQKKLRMTSDKDSEIDHDRAVSLPIVAYYSTGRLWKQRYLTLKKQSDSDFFSRTAAYVGCLDSGSDYKYFAEWFFYLYASDFEQKTKQLEKSGFESLIDHRFIYSDLMDAIKRPVDKILSPLGWKNISYSPSQKTLIVDHLHYGALKVDQLSDGLKSMIAMTADIAYRCARLNPDYGKDAALKTDGLVMIDEVDMHLHPRWQQLVLSQLQEAFPKVQFIVTTHSPQVLTTVASEHIRILRNNKVYAAPPGTEGAEPERLLKQILGLEDIRPPSIQATRELKEYLSLVDRDKWSSSRALELRKLLDERYQGNEPALLEADLQIENRKWELGE